MSPPAKDVYLTSLRDLGGKMAAVTNTPFAVFAKVVTLTTMNIRFEKMAFDKELREHPYQLTREIVDEAGRMFDQMREMAFIEETSAEAIGGRSVDVVEKHQELWQELWSPYDDTELKQLIDVRGNRLDANGLVPSFAGKDCVDMGCGNGSFSFALLERGARSVTGLDFGERQVERARAAARSLGVEDRTDFRVGSVLDTGLPDDHFEFALSNAVFHHLENMDAMEQALREVARILKKGSGFWYFVHGAGAIGMDLWDMSVEALAGVDIRLIENIVASMNPTRGKFTYIVDMLTATYIHSTEEETIAMLERCGFGGFRRLSGADATSYDLDRVEADPYGKEKFGSGELRLYCELTDK